MGRADPWASYSDASVSSLTCRMGRLRFHPGGSSLMLDWLPGAERADLKHPGFGVTA